jgi:hypothetical protein
MKTIFMVCCLCTIILTTASAQTKSDSAIPRLQKQGAATQLIVDGKPFLVRGAELNNSSASSLAYMKPVLSINSDALVLRGFAVVVAQ